MSTRNIDLGGNPLRELWTNAFTDVTLSEDLLLNGLEFKSIPTQCLNGVTARTIYMNDGGIEAIEPEAFYDVTVTEDM